MSSRPHDPHTQSSVPSPTMNTKSSGTPGAAFSTDAVPGAGSGTTNSDMRTPVEPKRMDSEAIELFRAGKLPTGTYVVDQPIRVTASLGC